MVQPLVVIRVRDRRVSARFFLKVSKFDLTKFQSFFEDFALFIGHFSRIFIFDDCDFYKSQSPSNEVRIEYLYSLFKTVIKRSKHKNILETKSQIAVSSQVKTR